MKTEGKRVLKDSRSVIANSVNTTAAKHGEQQGCGSGRWAIEREHRAHEGRRAKPIYKGWCGSDASEGRTRG